MKLHIGISFIGMSILLFFNVSYGNTKIEELESKLETVAGNARAALLNELSQAYHAESPEKVLKYGQEALEIARETQDIVQEALALENIGMSFSANKKYDMALNYFQQAQEKHKTIENKRGEASAFHKIGLLYRDQQDYTLALKNCSQALQMYEKLEAKEEMSVISDTIGNIYLLTEEYDKALFSYQRTLPLAREVSNVPLLRATYRNIAEMYLATGDIKQGKEYYTIYETLLHDEHGKAIAEIQERYDINKQEWEQAAHEKQKHIKNLKLTRQIIIVMAFIAVGASGGIAVFAIYRWRQQIQREQVMITTAKAKSDELLHNMLPVSIARNLQKDGAIHPQTFEYVTICFCDVFEFTKRSASLDPKLLFPELNALFTAFDAIIEEHDCERLKTIGHAYFYVCGMPNKNPHHAENVLLSALEILQYLEKRNQYAKMQWQIQLGVHTGRLIGGVVGIKKYIYEVFGATISIASAVKNASEPMRINISETTHNLVTDTFQCTEREPVKVKNQGMLNMYFVEGSVYRNDI